MPPTKHRIALFVDFENLESLYKAKFEKENQVAPAVNLEYLYAYVHKYFGILLPDDFIIIADLFHRQQQLGGLEKISKLVAVDQYLPQTGESQAAKTGTKRPTSPNVGPVALAFEAGKHIETRPAEYYLFLSGDPACAAVAAAIRDQHKKQVQFILPDPERASILKALFPILDFADLQPKRKTLEKLQRAAEEEQQKVEEPLEEEDHSARILEILAELRRELRTAIPADLLKVILGPQGAQKQLDRARSEAKIDIWENDEGITCVSSRDERIVGKIITMGVRPAVLKTTKILFSVASKSVETRFPLSRSEWRKFLRSECDLSNSGAKTWLESLFYNHILQDGQSGPLDLSPKIVLNFIQDAEKLLINEG